MAALKTEVDVAEKDEDKSEIERVEDVEDENLPTEETKKKKKKKKKKGGNDEQFSKKMRLCIKHALYNL